jgi:hypothetical protein
MVLITTVKNIEVISWLSVLLAGKTGVSGKKTTDLSQVTVKHYGVHITMRGI